MTNDLNQEPCNPVIIVSLTSSLFAAAADAAWFEESRRKS